MNSEPLLKIENLVKTYYLDGVEVEALRGVSFEIRKGESVSIMGPSGSGKSTLMHLIGCLDRPTSGLITIEGEQVSSLRDNPLAKVRNEKLSFVFQTFNLLPRATVLKNVELPLIYAGVSFGERTRRAKEELKAVGLGKKFYHRPNQLSGGEQQRVAIARALITGPSIILADEPTGNLDSKSGAEVMSILEKFHRLGRTIILSTHEKYLAEHTERVINILDGKIVSDKKVKNRQSAIKRVLEKP